MPYHWVLDRSLNTLFLLLVHVLSKLELVKCMADLNDTKCLAVKPSDLRGRY